MGEAKFESPIRYSVSDSLLIRENIIIDPTSTTKEELVFELAGPRSKLFFDPKHTRADIATCGGLCPGLNNVIRSLFLEPYYAYGVKEILGFLGGYQGLDSVKGKEPIVLTPEFVNKIHKEGGTVLGTSRGPVDVRIAVDNLIKREVNINFTVGGDGTQRGAACTPSYKNTNNGTEKSTSTFAAHISSCLLGAFSCRLHWCCVGVCGFDC